MRAPTSYAGPRRKVPKPKQVSQSMRSAAAAEEATVHALLEAKGDRIVSVKSSDSVQSAVRVLHEERIGAVLVLDAADALEGILSERDVVRHLPEITEGLEDVQVERLMTREVTGCAPDTPLSQVLHTMLERRFRHMPVMEEGRLIGIVTIGDAVKHRLQELEHETLSIKQMIVG
ncbi:MAG: CBS domain-containing protein [Pseudomonadota bacterium]